MLDQALELVAAGDVRGLEPQFNHSLLLKLYVAMKMRRGAGLFVPSTMPILEARNQPSPATEGTTAEGKIPDIQWGYLDDQLIDAMAGARFFHIECKRLGPNALNSRYVTEGIMRFVNAAWRYGKDVADGAMVGYLVEQDMDYARCVNTAIDAVDDMSRVEYVSDEVTRRTCKQTLTRSFAISPFNLSNTWVDVRPTDSPGVASTEADDLPAEAPVAVEGA